jgi:hypothetical protein
MPRTTPRPEPTYHNELIPATELCPACGRKMVADYHNHRTLTTLEGVGRFSLLIRRCHNQNCERFHLPFRPEAEGRLALPHHEFGLDVIATIGQLRYCQHRSVPEIHQQLLDRGIALAQRTVTNLLDRYDELRALTATNPKRLHKILTPQKRVVLAIDGLQPHVGHEVLWVVRDCLSGEILLARSLLSQAKKDLVGLLREVQKALPVPVAGMVSDGQDTIRKAIGQVFPKVPHQLCHFHYLREAAKPISEADRHAKKELKKRVRGVRAIERKVEEREDEVAEVISGYCAAVRSALSDDGPPPLQAPGLKLQERLTAISDSLDRVAKKGGCQPS